MSATEQKALFEACAAGDHSKLFSFIPSAHCPNLSALRDDNGRSLLHIACQHGKHNVVEALIQFFGCQLTSGDIAAVFHGNHLLLAVVIAQNSVDDILHIACQYGHLPIVRCIIHREIQKFNYEPRFRSESVQHPRRLPSELAYQVRDDELPVMVACRCGHIDIVKFLLEEVEYALASITDSMLAALLKVAAKYRRHDIAEYLITVQKADCTLQGSVPDVPFLMGWVNKELMVANTALNQAALHGDVSLVRLMLKYKKADSPTEDGNTPLHFASVSDSLKVIKVLVEKCGLNMNAVNNIKNTALHIACKWGSMHVAEYFLESDCDINLANDDNETAFIVAVNNGHEKLCEKLLSRPECRVDIFGRLSPLHYACYAGSSSMVQLLLQKGCDMNSADAFGITPLSIACYSGNTEAVTLLLERCNRSAENQFKETPFHILCRLNRLDLLKNILLGFECKLNMQNVLRQTPLHIACTNNAVDIIAFLLEQNYCDANVKGINGRTAMHIAVAKSQLQCVKLLKPFSDVSAQDCYGNTPVHLACKDVVGYEMAQCLLEDVPSKVMYITNKACDAAIHVACKSNCLKTVKYLIEKHHCDPSLPNTQNGNTPLHVACEVCCFPIAEYLLERCGVDPCSRNCGGNTPLCHAVQLPLRPLMDVIPLNDLMSRYDLIPQANFIMLLISKKLIDPSKQFCGRVPFIHFLFRIKAIDLVLSLIVNKFCQPVEKDPDGNTLLHVICSIRFHSIISDRFSNPDDDKRQMFHSFINALFSAGFEDLYLENFVNPQGSTPLHAACQVENMCFVEAMLKYHKIRKKFLSFKDRNRRTPIQLTHSFEGISLLIGYGANPEDVVRRFGNIIRQYEAKYPLKNVQVVVMGNSGAGKTTLIQALQKTEGPDVTEVGGPTSGIVPSKCHHATSGNDIVFHDFAGQPEFESCNFEFLRNLLCYTESPSLPIIILVFDASSQNVERNLHYWFSLLKNSGVQSRVKCPVILAGSHSDQISSSHDRIADVTKKVKESQFECFGPVLLDCRKVGSEEIAHLWESISESSSSLVHSIKKDCRCHIMFAFLHEIAVTYTTIQNLQSRIRKDRTNRHPLPFVRDEIVDILKTLHSEGHILLLKTSASDDEDDFFVIIHQEKLYHFVCGQLFAPKDNPDFESILKLDNNTGVVPASKLQKLFPNMDPIMCEEFLVHSEFCKPIKDVETLKLINPSLDNQQSSMEVQEEPIVYERALSSPTVIRRMVLPNKYYFFPGLVSREKPPDVYIGDADSYRDCYQCGWLLQCKTNEFLSPRFLQVLLLRFVFKFAAACSDSQFKRRCDIWKNGLSWNTTSGVEVFLEIVEQNTAVVLLMHCHEKREIHCVSLRSDIIEQILAVKEEFCKSTAVDEYILVNPSNPAIVTATDIDHCKKVNICDISVSVSKNEDFALDNFHKNVCLSKLLYFDGLVSIGKQQIAKLFDPELSETEVPNSFFLSIATSLENRDQYEQVLAMVKHSLPQVEQIEIANLEEDLDPKNEAKLIVNIFEGVWKTRKETYSDLRELLEGYSIFRGRNPLPNRQ